MYGTNPFFSSEFRTDTPARAEYGAGGAKNIS